jgi:hypothetical protein
MHDILTSPGFWFYSVIWFALVMMFTPPFEDWNWKQGIFAGVISGPVGWVLGSIVTILFGIATLWDLLKDKPKKS